MDARRSADHRRHQRDSRTGRFAVQEGSRGNEERGQESQRFIHDRQDYGEPILSLFRSLPDRQPRDAAAASENRDQGGSGPYARFRSMVSDRWRIELRDIAGWITARSAN